MNSNNDFVNFGNNFLAPAKFTPFINAVLTNSF